MPTSPFHLDAPTLETLLTLVRVQSPHPETMTLADAETAVMTVLRQIGPQLVQATLDADRPAPTAAKKTARRRSAAGRPCASGAGDLAR